MNPIKPAIVLASTSRYRATLLQRLNLPFQTQSPDVDEAHVAGETPADRAARLARDKACALAGEHPDSLLIGSDQVAAFGNEVFDKPGTVEKAVHALMALRGQRVDFHTALCVYRSATPSGVPHQTCVEHTDLTTVVLRPDLTLEEITRYVDTDQPLDCAGAFKVETCGIALFDAVHTSDPTALIGLPLIAVARALRGFGVRVP